MSDEREALKNTFAARAAKDSEAIRDRDNAALQPPPPRLDQRPAPNLAPPGMTGIRRGLPAPSPQPSSMTPASLSSSDSFNARTHPENDVASDRKRLESAGIDITSGDPDQDLWIGGRFRDQPQYAFTAKVYALPSEHGINGGRISKLSLYRDGELSARYDRGWDRKPETDEDRRAVERLRNVFDGPDRSIGRGSGRPVERDR